MEILVIWEFVSVGSSTTDDESWARCSMPLLHIHYLKNCGNSTQEPAYCSAHYLWLGREDDNLSFKFLEK